MGREEKVNLPRVTKQWNRLPRDVVGCPPCEISRTQADNVLSNLIWPWVWLFWSKGLNEVISIPAWIILILRTRVWHCPLSHHGTELDDCLIQLDNSFVLISAFLYYIKNTNQMPVSNLVYPRDKPVVFIAHHRHRMEFASNIERLWDILYKYCKAFFEKSLYVCKACSQPSNALAIKLPTG